MIAVMVLLDVKQHRVVEVIDGDVRIAPTRLCFEKCFFTLRFTLHIIDIITM